MFGFKKRHYLNGVSRFPKDSKYKDVEVTDEEVYEYVKKRLNFFDRLDLRTITSATLFAVDNLAEMKLMEMKTE